MWRVLKAKTVYFLLFVYYESLLFKIFLTIYIKI
ncbi:putative membrane protein, partial [Acinetobacter baumannii 34001]